MKPSDFFRREPKFRVGECIHSLTDAGFGTYMISERRSIHNNMTSIHLVNIETGYITPVVCEAIGRTPVVTIDMILKVLGKTPFVYEDRIYTVDGALDCVYMERGTEIRALDSEIEYQLMIIREPRGHCYGRRYIAMFVDTDLITSDEFSTIYVTNPTYITEDELKQMIGDDLDETIEILSEE